jgi:hypothetical protein
MFKWVLDTAHPPEFRTVPYPERPEFLENFADHDDPNYFFHVIRTSDQLSDKEKADVASCFANADEAQTSAIVNSGHASSSVTLVSESDPKRPAHTDPLVYESSADSDVKWSPSESLDIHDDDSLVLPAGLELPVFQALDRSGLLENATSDSDSGDERARDRAARVPRTKRAVLPKREVESAAPVNESSVLNEQSSCGEEASNVGVEKHYAKAKADVGSKREESSSHTRDRTSSPRSISSSPREQAASVTTYFVDLFHIRKLVAQYLSIEHEDLVEILVERENADPIPLTIPALLQQHPPALPACQLIPIHVPNLLNNVKPPPTHSSPKFRVTIVEYRWKSRQSSPPVAEFVSWGPDFFRKYCHAQEYFHYRDPEAEEYGLCAQEYFHAQGYFHSDDTESKVRDYTESKAKFCRFLLFLKHLNQVEPPQEIREILGASLSGEDITEMDDLGLTRSTDVLARLPVVLIDDESIGLLAVNLSGVLFGWLSQRLRSNREVVLAALKNGGRPDKILEEATENIRDDSEIIEWGLIRGSHCLKYASKRIQDDKELVIRAVSMWWLELKYASSRLQDDEEIVQLAVAQNPVSIRYASKRLKEQLRTTK